MKTLLGNFKNGGYGDYEVRGGEGGGIWKHGSTEDEWNGTDDWAHRFSGKQGFEEIKRAYGTLNLALYFRFATENVRRDGKGVGDH